MTVISAGFLRTTACAAGLVALAGCSSLTLPGGSNLISAPQNTTPTAQTGARPQPDARGVISYPNYQVAVAQRGDSVAIIAARLGLNPQDLADTNGLPVNTPLRPGELVLLNQRVDAAGPAAATGTVDVATIAGSALDRAEAQGGNETIIRAGDQATPAVRAAEPRRHTVTRGESAYSIARRYNVSVRALADWNGLGPDLQVREGQVLLIPVATGTAPVETSTVTLPGSGSPTPAPPSAATAQPEDDLPAPAQRSPESTATSNQNLAAQQTAASDTTRLAPPIAGGRIIRGYQPGQNEGLDFAATAGTPVRAAEAGTVAAITTDVDQVPTIVIRHSGGLLTVYANIDGVGVQKGAQVSRGQQLGTVRAGDPAFVHFEVRQGFDSVDPLDYLSQ
ncbi:MAG: LysM peptidoglycan-binding domain-containing protein [Qingshengfaniella sp.]